MKITHRFKSGNECTVEMPDSIANGERYDIHCQWERYPPSSADVREYCEVVYLEKILPAVEEACHQLDRGEWIEIEPGIRIRVGQRDIQ